MNCRRLVGLEEQKYFKGFGGLKSKQTSKAKRRHSTLYNLICQCQCWPGYHCLIRKAEVTIRSHVAILRESTHSSSMQIEMIKLSKLIMIQFDFSSNACAADNQIYVLPCQPNPGDRPTQLQGYHNSKGSVGQTLNLRLRQI